jgi:hypothetical protein
MHGVMMYAQLCIETWCVGQSESLSASRIILVDLASYSGATRRPRTTLVVAQLASLNSFHFAPQKFALPRILEAASELIVPTTIALV